MESTTKEEEQSLYRTPMTSPVVMEADNENRHLLSLGQSNESLNDSQTEIKLALIDNNNGDSSKFKAGIVKSDRSNSSGLENDSYTCVLKPVNQQGHRVCTSCQQHIIVKPDKTPIPTLVTDRRPSCNTTSESADGDALSLSNGRDMCRICHSEGEPPDNPLIQPCMCSGSMRFVHQPCLRRWIQAANIKSCELCRCQFLMTSETRPLKRWKKLELSQNDRRKLVCSIAFHVLALGCVVLSLYCLIERIATDMSEQEMDWSFWFKLVVIAIGFTGGVVFMYSQVQMYMSFCRKWKNSNRIVHIRDRRVLMPTGPSAGTAGDGTDGTGTTMQVSSADQPTTSRAAAEDKGGGECPPLLESNVIRDRAQVEIEMIAGS